jgi:MFS family permease
LFVLRIVFALAVAATSTNLSAVLADYPQDDSRGKLTGLAFILNGLGAVAFFVGLTQLPSLFQEQGVDKVWSGRYAYLIVAGIAFLTALVLTGIKPGRPENVDPKTPVMQLIREGLRAGRNKRISVAYIAAFAARADMAIITLFLVLWVTHASSAAGMTTAEAIGRSGMFVGICSLAALVWAPVFGIIADRIDRMKLTIVAFALATVGYGALGLTSDILSPAVSIPVLICVGIGQSSTALAITVLLGQEAPANIRGSVFGVQSFFGAIGILAIATGGGQLFDLVSPAAPFVAVALANLLVMISAVACIISERNSPPHAPQ